MAEDKLSWLSVLTFLQVLSPQFIMNTLPFLYERKSGSCRNTPQKNRFPSCKDNCVLIRAQDKDAISMSCQRESRPKHLKYKILRNSSEKRISVDKLEEKQHKQFLSRIIDEMGIGKDLKIDEIPPPVIAAPNRNEMNSISQNFSNLSQKFKAPGHLDAITGVISTTGNQTLVTISQDCLVKVWSAASLMVSLPQAQPLVTLRQHTGPLFSIAGGVYDGEEVVFVGGSQGYIKGWKLREGEKFKEGGKQQKQKIASKTDVFFLGGWANGGQQTVWDLDYKDEKLLSCSSDGLVRLYSLSPTPFKPPSSPTHIYKDKQFTNTTLKWVSSNTFLSGCSGVGRAMLWDLNGKVCSKYVYESGKGRDVGQVNKIGYSQTRNVGQVNKIGYCQIRKQVILACEDNTTRIYSLLSQSPVHSILTPSSPSTIAIKDHLLIIATHASSLHVVDMRRWNQICRLERCHQCKYDMGIGSVGFLGDMLVSGGADGVIKGWS